MAQHAGRIPGKREDSGQGRALPRLTPQIRPLKLPFSITGSGITQGIVLAKYRYQWAAPGDINAFFGLMLDNIAGLVLTVSMLFAIFEFPVDFTLRYMIPGTAIGVLVGDLVYFWLAFRLAAKDKRSDVCAMPLGLDTPSTIGMILFVLGPAFLGAKASGMGEEQAAMHAWHIGICAIIITGLVKAVLAVGSGWIRNVFPRAGLLGSLLAIALVLIAFIQLEKLSLNPIVGFASLVIVFATLISRGKLPFKIPGALGAVLAGCVIWYVLLQVDSIAGTSLAHQSEAGGDVVWFPLEWLSVFSFQWTGAFTEALGYLPYIIPFAIATVIGGIDCTESAASAGDEYSTSQIIGTEAFATLVAGLCGGVIQTTPYIGHPAYKTMGGRAAYTLATAAFVGGAGLIGYFSFLFQWIPEAAVLPILIFIGIEITAQSFQATPKRHYAALAVACLPALAKLVMVYLGQFGGAINWDQVTPQEAGNLQNLTLHLQILAGGFIITSLIWGSAVARIIDRRFYSAAMYWTAGGIMVLFGFMHSPLNGDKMFWPWQIGMVTEFDGTVVFKPEVQQAVIQFAVAYFVMAGLMLALGFMLKQEPINSDEEFEQYYDH